MNKSIKIISFDLDNTLWDVDPVIHHAEKAMFNYVQNHYPELLKTFNRDKFWQLRKAIVEQQPELAHRLSQLRVEVLKHAFLETQRNEKDAENAALDCFSVFFSARHDVELYHSVEENLSKLHQHYKIVALSNGNTDIRRIGLDKYFSAAFTAEMIGYAKPHQNAFNIILERNQINPEEMVHVGDHHIDDISGAQAIGIKTIWFNNKENDWPLEDIQPDAEVKHWDEFPHIISQL